MIDGLVSIIMPSWNTEKYIGYSIQSVINQTYTKWELIIVDDCSTDNTDKVIHAFLPDSRIRYFKNKKNTGAAISRNKGLQLAKGQWVAFLDSDDIWLPTKLEKQIGFMITNGYVFSFTDYQICSNGIWEPFICTGPNIVTRRKFFDYCYVFTSTVMYDQTVIGLIQIADIKKNNDYAMWFEVSKKASCYRFPECLSYYIKHEKSISSCNKFKLIKYHYFLYRNALHLNCLFSVLLTCNNLFWGCYKKIRYKVRTNEKPFNFKKIEQSPF